MKVLDATGFTQTSDVRSRDWTSFRHLGGAGTSVLYPAGANGGTAMTAIAWTSLSGSLYTWPFIAPARGPIIDVVQIDVTTAGVGGTIFARVGIYTNIISGSLENGEVLFPGSLLVDSGDVSSSATGVKSLTTGSINLDPGSLYWIAFTATQPTTTIHQFRSIPIAAMHPVLGWDNTFGTAATLGFSQSFAYGPLPVSFATGSAAGKFTSVQMASIPCVALRFAT